MYFDLLIIPIWDQLQHPLRLGNSSHELINQTATDLVTVSNECEVHKATTELNMFYVCVSEFGSSRRQTHALEFRSFWY